MKKFILAAVILLAGCTAQPQIAGTGNELNETQQHLASGVKLLASRNTKRAIDEFDLALKGCEHLFSAQSEKVYASRSVEETVFYMMRAAAKNEAAITVSNECSDALYLKGYASLDLGRIETAEEHIQKAVDLAPMNALYLSELGHLYHVRKNWTKALESFSSAEKAAEQFSPVEVKLEELSRAKRGIGFSLIELGKLEEAERKFRECLELDPDDASAKNELTYIEQLRMGHSPEQ